MFLLEYRRFVILLLHSFIAFACSLFTYMPYSLFLNFMH